MQKVQSLGQYERLFLKLEQIMQENSQEIQFSWRRPSKSSQQLDGGLEFGQQYKKASNPIRLLKSTTLNTSFCLMDSAQGDQASQDQKVGDVLFENDKENLLSEEPSYIKNSAKSQSEPAVKSRDGLDFKHTASNLGAHNLWEKERRVPLVKRSILGDIVNRQQTPSKPITIPQHSSAQPCRTVSIASPLSALNSNYSKDRDKGRLRKEHTVDNLSALLEAASQDDFVTLSIPSDFNFCGKVIEDLGLNNGDFPVQASRDVVALFECISEKGLLTTSLLKEFLEYGGEKITTLSLSPSFGEKSDESLPFLVRKPEPETLKELFKLFFVSSPRVANVEFLDLTLVPLDDDLLRFIIRMGNLKGIGLAGTRVTVKGLKYLTKHCTFKGTLETMLLSGNEFIQDDCIPFIKQFENLKSLDLRRTSVTYHGILDLITVKKEGSLDRRKSNAQTLEVQHEPFLSDIFEPSQLQTLKIPQSVYDMLLEQHTKAITFHPSSLMPCDATIVSYDQMLRNPNKAFSLGREACKKQLEFYKKVFGYRDIYLELDHEDLQKKLYSITVDRLREEKIWSLL